MKPIMWIGSILLFSAVMPANGEVLPVARSGDLRIQSVLYDRDQVILLRVADGYALTVLFSPDERIETVTLGNGTAWQVEANRRATHLVIKSRGAAAATNMTVLTDGRAYNFKLANVAPAADVPFLVSFDYPPPSFGVEPASEATQATYRLQGKRELRPSSISDNGRDTSIVWSPDATLPAVYSVGPKGNEALVNGLMQNGAYEVQGIHNKLVFKLGRDEASATRREANASGNH